VRQRAGFRARRLPAVGRREPGLRAGPLLAAHRGPRRQVLQLVPRPDRRAPGTV